ncbi:MAG: hypothetical protein ACOYOK_10910 [Pseudobdellovibrionaceae bacterium]
MKSLHQNEVTILGDTLSEYLLDSQLQEVWLWDHGLQLGLYKRKMFWLIFDLQQNTPFIYLSLENPLFTKSRLSKPVSLFLKSKAENQLLKKIYKTHEYERVIVFDFGSEDSPCHMVFQMIPRNVNLTIQHKLQQVHWHKPRPVPEKNAIATQSESYASRTFEHMQSEWKSIYSNDTSSSKPSSKQLGSANKMIENWQLQHAKKNKLLQDLKKQIEDLEIKNLWGQAGEELKVHGMDGCAEAYLSYIDQTQSLSWNIQNCFLQAKQQLQKIKGRQERLEVLQKEVLQLEQKQFDALQIGLSNQENLANQSVQEKTDLKKTFAGQKNLKFRTGVLSSGKKVYFGKSAADNLGLLRAAKPWFLWFHLRDYPGTHGICEILRNENPSIEDLQQIGRYLLEYSLKTFESNLED